MARSHHQMDDAHSDRIKKKNTAKLQLVLREMGIVPNGPTKNAYDKILKAAWNEHTATINNFIKVMTVMLKHGVKGPLANDFLNGAHFALKDNGSLFNDLCKLGIAEERGSSHYSELKDGRKQVGISCGALLPELLLIQSPEHTIDPVSKVAIPTSTGRTQTNFQTEGSPWRGKEDDSYLKFAADLLRYPEHVRDCALYAYTQVWTKINSEKYPAQNVGAFGYSTNYDRNPISGKIEKDGTVTWTNPEDAKKQTATHTIEDKTDIANTLSRDIGQIATPPAKINAETPIMNASQKLS